MIVEIWASDILPQRKEASFYLFAEAQADIPDLYTGRSSAFFLLLWVLTVMTVLEGETLLWSCVSLAVRRKRALNYCKGLDLGELVEWTDIKFWFICHFLRKKKSLCYKASYKATMVKIAVDGSKVKHTKTLHACFSTLEKKLELLKNAQSYSQTVVSAQLREAQHCSRRVETPHAGRVFILLIHSQRKCSTFNRISLKFPKNPFLPWSVHFELGESNCF